MSINVLVFNTLSNTRSSKTWNKGDSRVTLSDYEQVEAIQATGPELTAIMSNFSGIPKRLMPPSKHVQWRQPFATFILDNIV